MAKEADEAEWPASSRQCCICETVRPESKMTRAGRNWKCSNENVCGKGVATRKKAAGTDYPTQGGWVHSDQTVGHRYRLREDEYPEYS